MNKLLYLLLVITCIACKQDSQTEKRQSQRDKVIHVHDRVKEIGIDEVLVGSIARVTILNNCIIISDPMSQNKLIHLLDKNQLKYITSIGERGQGPEEITNMGFVGVNEAGREFYVSDHGKQSVFSYKLDSVLLNPLYMPKLKTRMKERQFPSSYQYISDALCVGLIVEPTGNSGFNQSLAKWNMNTGEIEPMKYVHPDIEKKRVDFAVSPRNGVYVECYNYYDLMTICTLNGELKYNIYGPNWDPQKTNKVQYYDKVSFCKDKILTTFSGEDTFLNEKDKGPRVNCPTKFIVFDMNGDYIQTIETDYHISDYCYDEENNRVIMSLDDEIQFAYLSLDGII